MPKGNGKATIVARGGSVEATCDGRGLGDGVRQAGQLPELTWSPRSARPSCNMGACHGTPTGKGGFRLSLRGYLPDQDFGVVTREAAGRRINVLAAESSILLTQAARRGPPRGGPEAPPQLQVVRVPPRLDEAEGARDDPGRAGGRRGWRSQPGPRVLNAPAKTQAGGRRGPLRGRDEPRRDADLLLQLVQPRDRRRRRRWPHHLQEPGRGRRHRPPTSTSWPTSG